MVEQRAGRRPLTAGLGLLLVAWGCAHAAPPAAPGLASVGLAAAPAPWVAQVEQVLELPARAPDGTALRELSALAWDAQARELMAASDRGRLFRLRLRLRVADGRLQADVMSALRLDRLEPAAANANPEALDWRAPGVLLLAGEQAPNVLRLTAEGRVIGTLPWPAAVATALAAGADAGQRHGVEAMAWHREHGLLAGLQRPTRADEAAQGAARLHWVHAASGARWGFQAAGPRSALKAIEARPDGTLLILERVQHPGDTRLHTVLRWLDPARCAAALPCPAPVVPVLPAPLVGEYNHEGLACTHDGTCWIVNDNGADAAQATRLTQFRLVPR